MIQVHLDPAEIKSAAELALSHHLFVEGWSLKESLMDIASGTGRHNCSVIALWHHGDRPIGICTVWRHHKDHNGSFWVWYAANFFVDEAHRQKGIANSLFTAVYPHFRTANRIELYTGNRASRTFLTKLADTYENVCYVGDG